MTAGVVSVGGRRYAVGLYWENSPGGGRVAQIAKEAASQPGTQADFYVVRPGNKDGRIPQFGLCSGEAGQKAGMPVLAGCLASQIPGSWVGAFRLHEGVVVTVVRDDLIVPDGDLFFLDEAEARDRLIQEVGFGGLQSTYAPESWSIPGADTIPLTLLLNNRQDIKLQPVTIPKQVKIIAAALALVFVIILGGVWYWQEEVAKEEALRAQQEEAIHRAQEASKNLLPLALQQQTPPPTPKYERTWELAPAPLAFVEACRKGLEQIPAAIVGWRLTSMKCSGSALDLTFNRDKGMSLPPADSHVSDTGLIATKSISLQTLSPRGAEPLVDPNETTRRFLLQNWPASLNRIANDPLPPPPADYKGTWNPPLPPWVKRSFTLSIPELPGSLPLYFGGFPGVVINVMSYSPSGISGMWVVEGVIYENRK